MAPRKKKPSKSEIAEHLGMTEEALGDAVDAVNVFRDLAKEDEDDREAESEVEQAPKPAQADPKTMIYVVVQPDDGTRFKDGRVLVIPMPFRPEGPKTDGFTTEFYSVTSSGHFKADPVSAKLAQHLQAGPANTPIYIYEGTGTSADEPGPLARSLKNITDPRTGRPMKFTVLDRGIHVRHHFQINGWEEPDYEAWDAPIQKPKKPKKGKKGKKVKKNKRPKVRKSFKIEQRIQVPLIFDNKTKTWKIDPDGYPDDGGREIDYPEPKTDVEQALIEAAETASLPSYSDLWEMLGLEGAGEGEPVPEPLSESQPSTPRAALAILREEALRHADDRYAINGASLVLTNELTRIEQIDQAWGFLGPVIRDRTSQRLRDAFRGVEPIGGYGHCHRPG